MRKEFDVAPPRRSPYEISPLTLFGTHEGRVTLQNHAWISSAACILFDRCRGHRSNEIEIELAVKNMNIVHPEPLVVIKHVRAHFLVHT
jgi:hypothetical protein